MKRRSFITLLGGAAIEWSRDPSSANDRNAAGKQFLASSPLIYIDGHGRSTIIDAMLRSGLPDRSWVRSETGPALEASP